MSMNKQRSLEEAIASIPNGAVIMVGGFGCPGTPFTLIEELVNQGQSQLTLIKNDANETGLGISKLIEAGQVKKLVTTHIGLNKFVVDKLNSGELEVEFFPQGILAEKVRTAGAGSFGFLSDIGMESEITVPSQLISWKGKTFKVEEALTADFALIHASKADYYGNLVYSASAINFSPLMAMAAERVIVESANIVAPGELDPATIHTPGAFVSSVVALEKMGDDYGLVPGRVTDSVAQEGAQ